MWNADPNAGISHAERGPILGPMSADHVGTPENPALSLVVATTAGWPDYRPLFEGHRVAVEAVDGEVIVADGSGRAAPAPDEIGPHATWLAAPGEGVFQLRALAYPRARAAIVAVTEDHCVLGPEWGRTLLGLHAEHPDAAVIGGVVENASRRRLDDWAVFFIGHFRDMPGVGRAQRVALAGLTNVSYKRRALEGMTPIGDMGVNEAFHQRALAASGEILLIDDRLRVEHVQSPGLRGMVMLMWHSARTTAAMRRRRMSSAAMLRLVAAPVSPLVFGALIASAVVRRRYAPLPFLVSSPAILGFLSVRAVAEVVGYLAGPGDSMRRFL